MVEREQGGVRGTEGEAAEVRPVPPSQAAGLRRCAGLGAAEPRRRGHKSAAPDLVLKSGKEERKRGRSKETERCKEREKPGWKMG